ncbi:MAG: hypothetical protein H6672_03190 [Anaerolineaceae bacterium]|nr:hypothetical protein [Anaerolineaceae bacterium]
MAKYTAKKKFPPSRFWLILSVITLLAIPALCILALFSGGQDLSIGFLDDYRSTPGPWRECSFAFAEGSGQVTLMRRRMPGLVGFHAEFELQMFLHTIDGTFTVIPWGYTEDSTTDVYAGTALLKDNRRVPVLQVKSYGQTYRFDMEAMRVLSFSDAIDEFDMVYLGHFNEINEFIPLDSSVIPLPDQCGDG